jgi:aminopeptidase YwaD
LRYDHGGDAGIPVAMISRAAAAKILAEPNTTIEAYEEAADSRKFTSTAAQTTNTGNGDSIGRTITRQEMLWLPPQRRFLTLSTDVRRAEAPAYNVVGVLEGSDPVLKKENIVIGAHYDHLGRGGEGSGSLAPRSGEIHHGADDNASGTAGLIELARVFSAQRPRLKRTVVFIAFGGEEEGLLGSNYYVNNPLTPLSNTVAMINMDMIGRMKDGKLMVGGVGTAKEWRQIIGQNSDFSLTLNEDGFGPSDHSSFYGKQVPVLFFFTGTHTDYHKPSDTFEKINYKDEAKILNLVARIVRDVDGADKRLTYATAKSDATPRTGGFRVFLGTIPNYGEGSNGLLIDGVREGSPAEKAGIKAGDRIVKIGEREIKNVYDYTYALGEMKAGQEYVFEIVRGTEKLSLKLTPEARK